MLLLVLDSKYFVHTSVHCRNDEHEVNTFFFFKKKGCIMWKEIVNMCYKSMLNKPVKLKHKI